MDDPRLEWEVGRRAWKLFPRSFAILSIMIGAALSGSLFESEWIVNLGAGIWVVLIILRLMMLDIYMRNIWLLVGIPIKTISAWPIRWGLVIILYLIASGSGMTTEELFMVVMLYFMASIVEWIILPKG